MVSIFLITHRSKPVICPRFSAILSSGELLTICLPQIGAVVLKKTGIIQTPIIPFILVAPISEQDHEGHNHVIFYFINASGGIVAVTVDVFRCFFGHWAMGKCLFSAFAFILFTIGNDR